MCPFEMQRTLRKVIKMATAFVKSGKLRPCSPGPHLTPFVHSTHSEEIHKMRGIELSEQNIPQPPFPCSKVEITHRTIDEQNLILLT